ncbi:corticotropin-releasing factor receptor 2-like [Glandiceps talaboti]
MKTSTIGCIRITHPAVTQVVIAAVMVIFAGSMTTEGQTDLYTLLNDDSTHKIFEMFGLNRSDPEHVCYFLFFIEPYPDPLSNGSRYCNTTHDSISCWPTSRPGMVSVPCPAELNKLKYDTTDNVTRVCRENGTWDKSDYSECHLKEDIYEYDLEADPIHGYHYDAVFAIMIAGYTISLVALVVAFVIFAIYRSLSCVRNNIHWNLMSTFILRNITFFIIYKTIRLETKEDNEWPCRLLSTVYNYFQETNFFWMFVEGLYLHTVIVLAFQAEKVRFWMYMVIGWCVPLVFTFIWAVMKYLYENNDCWLPPKGVSSYDYIYQGPIILVLILNFIFLFNIVRVLITKLRASNTLETRQYRKAVKATVVLLPLLGLTYILFFMNPAKDSTTARLIFFYFNGILQSTQGLAVAVFYVFLNGEVRSVIRRKFNRWRDSKSLGRHRSSRNQSIISSASRQGLTLNIFRDSKRKYSKESKTEIEVVSQMNSNGTPNGVEPTPV